MTSHQKKLQRPEYNSDSITFPSSENNSYKTNSLSLNAVSMSSLYSHITLSGVLSVKQRLNGSPFYRETPLKKKEKCKELP